MGECKETYQISYGPVKSGRRALYQCALYDNFPRVLNGQKD